jgi:hypothetical protein
MIWDRIRKNKEVMCWVFMIYLVLGMISICWIASAEAQEGDPPLRQKELTEEQVQFCKRSREAAESGMRPVVFPGPVKDTFKIVDNHYMLEASQVDMVDKITIIAEEITDCGVIMQVEDIDGDGKGDRKIMWVPVFLPSYEDIFFMPSHPAAGLLHPDSEWKNKITTPKGPGTTA